MFISAKAQHCPSHMRISTCIHHYWNCVPGFNIPKKPNANPRYWYNLGRTATDNENYSLAITYYTKALSLDSTFSEAYKYRGLAKCAYQNYYDAIQDFDAAIKLNPKDAEAYNSRGAVYEELNILNVAIHDYKKAIYYDPINKHYKENLANVLDKQAAK